MISTSDLVHSIPPYLVDIISSRILGKPVDADALARKLKDGNRLRQILDDLPQELFDILLELYWLEGWAEWDTLARIHRSSLDDFRARLKDLGEQGLVFQAGISGREALIILPGIIPLIRERLDQRGRQAENLSWQESAQPDYWNHVVLINQLQAAPIRCRPGLEPFKKGWMLLNDALGEFMDVGRIYWELVSLGCLCEYSGNVRVRTAPAMQLVMADISRYQTWRLLQSCKPYNGLEFRLLEIFASGCIDRRTVQQALWLELCSDFDTAESAAAETLIDQWLDLGILEQSKDSDRLRLNPAVHRGLVDGSFPQTPQSYVDEVFLQPNMEILVPKDMDPVEHLHIGQVAELKKADIVSIYRITKKSISSAVRNGWTATDIKNLLERISRHALPENVAVTVDGWGTKLPDAELIEGTFLFTDTPTERLPQEVRQVRPGVYLVPQDIKDSIIEQLNKKGIIPDQAPQEDEQDQPEWGRELPLVRHKKTSQVPRQKNGFYPYGLIKPMPYGSKGLDIFEKARKEGRSVLIFYPAKGYGAIQARKIRPFSIYSTGGVPFTEAFCEDSGEGEVFDLSKVRGILDE